MDRRSFGRRGVSQPASAQIAAAPVAFGETSVARTAFIDLESTSEASALSLDEELREWKEQRAFKVPWKQMYLMASLCFGVASFVLPDRVNSSVNWVLYALTAMSFYAWLKGRGNRAKS